MLNNHRTNRTSLNLQCRQLLLYKLPENWMTYNGALILLIRQSVKYVYLFRLISFGRTALRGNVNSIVLLQWIWIKSSSNDDDNKNTSEQWTTIWPHLLTSQWKAESNNNTTTTNNKWITFCASTHTDRGRQREEMLLP